MQEDHDGCKQEKNEQSPIIPEDAEALAEFVLMSIGNERMDLAGDAWLKMHSLYGSSCAQVCMRLMRMRLAHYEPLESRADILYQHLTSVPTYCVKRDDLVEEEGARECNFVAHIDVLHICQHLLRVLTDCVNTRLGVG